MTVALHTHNLSTQSMDTRHRHSIRCPYRSLPCFPQVAAIDSCSPISAVALVFEGGSAFETAGKAGISRVLESVAFKVCFSVSFRAS